MKAPGAATELIAGRPAAPRAPGLLGGGLVSLHTLILIRWVAVVGQAAAVAATAWVFGYDLPAGAAFAVIGVSVLLNLAAMVQGRTRVRLGERDAALYLGYDLVQLSVLLFLTGGILNPFVVLLLAPLTVSATTLARGSTILLTAIVLASVSLLALWHYPVPGGGGVLDASPTYRAAAWVALCLSAIFVTWYVRRVAEETRRVGDALAASQLALARSQRATALGALAAAAAHELGTPLATISLTAKELASDLPEGSLEADDARLLAEQADRCRTILSDLAARPDSGGGDPFDRLSLTGLIEAAAAPHARADIDLLVEPMPLDASEAPKVAQTPELIHGLGNLLQNALQFARRRVTVRAEWSRQIVRITITDDGPGFPPGLINRLGEPYISGGTGGRDRRGGDAAGHMGLGIFIASTLLESTGATVRFAGERGGGAQVAVDWRRTMLEVKE
ncbi:MAG: ActS/PrrB/RegB family redox-sensitive histidine kinase [Alphaproteobacteria bacterium]|jgi:two-component system sensor histidine kinase RegB|nr:ActS/PrrB/RegB family redox-sensitive histidine kinase [Alphaproteobacteria bacterium]